MVKRHYKKFMHIHCGVRLYKKDQTMYWYDYSEDKICSVVFDTNENLSKSRVCSKRHSTWFELWCLDCARKEGIVW